MTGRHTNVGDTFGAPTVTATYEDEFSALESLPPAVRVRLVHATLPMAATDLVAAYKKVLAAGYPQRAAEFAIIDCIKKTEDHYAALLEKERSTWNLGEEMARSIKAVTAKLRGTKHETSSASDSA